MTNKKFIAGAGISSLIFSYYNPGYTIIAPKEGVGGKLSQDFLKNTIYLHQTKESEDFLNEVGIPYKKRTHTIKYCKGGEIRREIYIVDKIAMIKKKMRDDNFEVLDTNLSVEDYYITVLDVDYQLLIKKLLEKATILEETIIRITENQIVTDKTSHEYDELISTLPAPIFWTLFYQSKGLEFKAIPVTFALCDEAPSILTGVPFDLIYFVDSKYKYTRINSYDNQYLYEFSGELSQDEVKKHLPKNANIIKYFVDPMGIIFTNTENIPPKNVRFLGRFSVWNHSIKTNDVISESKFSYDFRHIFSRQKDFFNRVEGLNTIQTLEQKEQKTHSMILHLFDEISEVLNETNYKKHKFHKDVNVSKVREELIDAFKYLLNLAIVWDIDLKMFVEEFNKKSDVVDKRWEEFKKK